MTPEAKARQTIDQKLAQAGWIVLGPVLDPVNAFGLAGQERVFWHVRDKST